MIVKHFVIKATNIIYIIENTKWGLINITCFNIFIQWFLWEYFKWNEEQLCVNIWEVRNVKCAFKMLLQYVNEVFVSILNYLLLLFIDD